MNSMSISTQSTTSTLSPAELFRKLKSIDVLILDNLAFLSRLRATTSPTGAAYATPGRRWLAAQAGVSESTITRHTTRLKHLGVLEKRQRRPIDGKWQTNIYFLIGRATRLVARSLQAMRGKPNRRAIVRDIAPSEGKLSASSEGKVALRALIQSLSQKFGRG